MDDELFDLLDNLVKNASQAYQMRPKQPLSKNWVKCFELWKAGWKVEEYLEAPNSDDILVKWIKDNDRKEILLKLSDQMMWLEFLEKHNK